MKEIFCEKFEMDNPWHQRDAYSISHWSKKSDSMLSIDAEELQRHPYGVLANKSVLGIVGYVALKELTYDGSIGQIGALIAHPRYQGNGVASALVANVLKVAPEEFPDMEAAFAYANEDSAPVFIRHGGIIAGERQSPSSTGCNTIIDLSQAMGLPGVVDISLTDILNVNEARVS